MVSPLDVPPETLEKLLHLSEQANSTPAEFLNLLLSSAEQHPIPQLSTDDQLHQWVLSNISDTVLITKDDGNFTYVCPNVHIIFNYTDDEVWHFGNVEALGLGDLYRSDVLGEVGEIANIDTQIMDKAGNKHYLLVNVKQVNLAGGTVLYVCRDNTARKHMELRLAALYEEINRYAAELESRVIERTAELQRKSEQVEAILNHTGDANALVDFEGMIQQANFAFYQYFGRFTNETQSQIFTSLFDDEQAAVLSTALAKVFQTGQSQRLEILALRHDGIPFDADVLMSPVYAADQHVVSVICSFRDITERKHIEAELRRSLHHEQELNEVRSRFVSTLSHEYRTPLAVILSSSDILLHHVEVMSGEQRTQHLDRIQHQVQHMTALLDDLVAISKTEIIGLDLKTEAVDIGAFCQTVVVEVQSSTTTHHLEFTAREDGGIVLVDKKLMRQVIYNLLSNAIKYSHPGSTVHIDLECEAPQIRLSVKDHGIGIPANELDHLFEVYYRAQNVGAIQGTGLGLPIIRRAVEAHGGTVSVESTVNTGTIFTVTLPRQLTILSD